MKYWMTTTLILVAVASVANVGWAQENWPQWRGPEGTGVAAAGEYPIEFSNRKQVAWKVELPGRGSSTPAVWQDKIFVTCAIDDKDGVLCFDFKGQELWRKPLGREKVGKHKNGSGSNASPVTDGQHVIVYYKSGTAACLDFAGDVVWQKNLVKDYGKDTLWWDRATSPVLADGNAVIAVMQDGDSYLVALDVATGDEVWKQPRNYQCEKESDQAYTTPSVVESDGQQVIVTWGADHLTGHAAKDGKLLWECGGFNPEGKPQWRTIASAAVDQQVAVVPYGRGNFLASVNLADASGDVTQSHRGWENEEVGADVPTPLLHGPNVIVLTDKGRVVCLDKQSGEQQWAGAFPRAKAKFYASPVLAGDVLYCAREDGTIFVAKIDDGFKAVAENKLGESVVATPIPIRNHLLVRGEKHLFLIE